MKDITEYIKGDMVRFNKREYHLQDNGKGSLHIVVWEAGKRRKMGLKRILFGGFEPGSFEDYVFNGRFLNYTTFELYVWELKHQKILPLT
jgi:hypothetical protein